ncbi:MAG: hypothetical protein GX557_15215 [Chloroflexi bacterium]|nr:hypothetical protein [Chloroflexota bacterium]
MRNTRVLVTVGAIAVLLWAALVLIVNYVQPDPLGQALFLLVLSLAALTTATPIAYLLGVRWGRPLGPKGDLARAFRQGMFAAMLVLLLMALRLMRMLTPLTAIILTAIVTVLELLFYLRRR